MLRRQDHTCYQGTAVADGDGLFHQLSHTHTHSGHRTATVAATTTRRIECRNCIHAPDAVAGQHGDGHVTASGSVGGHAAASHAGDDDTFSNLLISMPPPTAFFLLSAINSLAHFLKCLGKGSVGRADKGTGAALHSTPYRLIFQRLPDRDAPAACH